MKPAEVILEQCLGMSYKGAVVPGQQSADEGFRNGGSHFCCAFRHPDERRAVVDAWESTTTDVLGQNAILRCWGHVSTQAAWQAAVLPQVLVGSPIAMASHWLPGPSAVLMLGLANCKIRSLLKNQTSSCQGGRRSCGPWQCCPTGEVLGEAPGWSGASLHLVSSAPSFYCHKIPSFPCSDFPGPIAVASRAVCVQSSVAVG